VCVCVYQYARAICRAELSTWLLLLLLPSVGGACWDAPFLRSRAVVRRWFLALSLSMHLVVGCVCLLVKSFIFIYLFIYLASHLFC